MFCFLLGGLHRHTAMCKTTWQQTPLWTEFKLTLCRRTMQSYTTSWLCSLENSPHILSVLLAHWMHRSAAMPWFGACGISVLSSKSGCLLYFGMTRVSHPGRCDFKEALGCWQPFWVLNIQTVRHKKHASGGLHKKQSLAATMMGMAIVNCDKVTVRWAPDLVITFRGNTKSQIKHFKASNWSEVSFLTASVLEPVL